MSGGTARCLNIDIIYISYMMAPITSDCCAMRSLKTKWPESRRTCAAGVIALRLAATDALFYLPAETLGRVADVAEFRTAMRMNNLKRWRPIHPSIPPVPHAWTLPRWGLLRCPLGQPLADALPSSCTEFCFGR